LIRTTTKFPTAYLRLLGVAEYCVEAQRRYIRPVSTRMKLRTALARLHCQHLSAKPSLAEARRFQLLCRSSKEIIQASSRNHGAPRSPLSLLSRPPTLTTLVMGNIFTWSKLVVLPDISNVNNIDIPFIRSFTCQPYDAFRHYHIFSVGITTVPVLAFWTSCFFRRPSALYWVISR
jgi:hypothetical protein